MDTDEFSDILQFEEAGDLSLYGDLKAQVEQSPDPRMGMEFDSLDSACAFYFHYARNLGFRVRTSRFRTSRKDESIIMRRFVCSKEGFYLKRERRAADVKERKKRGSMREGCLAMFEVVKKNPNRWVVHKLVKDHSHAFTVPIKPRTKKTETRAINEDPGWIDYWGRGGEAFNLMEYLKRKQSRNPNFFYSLRVDDESNLVTDVFWVDARARSAFFYFGDVVYIDTTCRKMTRMIPFVSFTGINHHLQHVNFGCGIIFGQTESSFSWLLESFYTAMNGKAPLSLVLEPDVILKSAALKVFPGTRLRFCKRRILHRMKEELPRLRSDAAVWRDLKADLKCCMDDSETVEDFESSWKSILSTYDLERCDWIRWLYSVREYWAAVFLKDSFFGEISSVQKFETLDKFFRRNFKNSGGALVRDFIARFDQELVRKIANEVRADHANSRSGPSTKISTEMEKQAAEVYTENVFAIFEEELKKSTNAGLTAESYDGRNWNYDVADRGKLYRVDFGYQERRARCSCRKFDFCGILCSHTLSVFSHCQISRIPEDYFLRRWTRNAKSRPILFESDGGDLLVDRRRAFSYLSAEIFMYAEEGSTSSLAYAAAKNALKKAFAEITAAKEEFS